MRLTPPRRPTRFVARATAAASVLAVIATLAMPAATAAAARRSGGVGASVSARASADITADITADANWLLQGQLPDGAIAWYIDKRHISPYLANYAAIGLAEAARRTGSRTYSDAAWAWLDWYAAHQDAHGVVTDYDVDATGAEISTGDEDSTDAYAGTYLSAVRATYLVTGNGRALRALHTSITAAVGVIESTQDVDGLTWAKPSYRVKYLMDETETYNGLRSAVDLGFSLGDWGLVRRAWSDAHAMRAGIASLWDPATEAYDWAKGDGGWVDTANWSVLYPDSMEQAWIAGASAIGNRRARLLVDELQRSQPEWDSPNAVVAGNPVGYWPVAGWALLRVHDMSGAQAAAASIRSAALADARDWPFTTGDAGQLIVLESGDASLITP